MIFSDDASTMGVFYVQNDAEYIMHKLKDLDKSLASIHIGRYFIGYEIIVQFNMITFMKLNIY